ncbi:MAG: hypothetical protein GYA18_04235 [Chloroflexi bacterium]|nr:hypothetical protein [Chloroflexota bacterium]
MREARSLGRSVAPLADYARQGATQIAIIVPDVEKTAAHYMHLFGIGPWHFYTYKKPLLKHMTYYGKPANYVMRIALSYFGPTRIELIQSIAGESIYTDFVREHGYGVHHIGLVVADMDRALQDATSAGLTMTMDGAGFGLSGDGHFAYLNTEKELGVTIEFIENPQNRVLPEKIFPDMQN